MDYDRFSRFAVGSMVRFGILFIVFLGVSRLELSAWVELGILLATYLVVSAAQFALRRKRPRDTPTS